MFALPASKHPCRSSHPFLRIAALLVLAGTNALPQANSNARPFALDDLFNLHQIPICCGGALSISPDGRKLAFVVQRPMRSPKPNDLHLLGNERSDVYVLGRSGQAINVTNGQTDGASYFAPQWSPDGNLLGMLTDKSGNVTPWVWEEASESLRQASDRGLDLSYWPWPDQFYIWASPTQIIYPVAPPGKTSNLLTLHTRAQDRAVEEWMKTRKGTAAAVSVLQSGVKPDLSKRKLHGGLMVLDVGTGKSHELVEGEVVNFAVSPDGHSVACARRVEAYQPRSDEPLPFWDLNGKYELVVTSVDGTPLLPESPVTWDILPTSLRWSPNGDELAFVTYGREHGSGAQFARFLRSSRTLRVIAINEFDPVPLVFQNQEFQWTERGWLVYSSQPLGPGTERAHARRDWRFVSNDGSVRLLTGKMTVAPNFLFRAEGRGSFVGLADGALWRIHPDELPEKLTLDFAAPISKVVWPVPASGGEGYAPTTSGASFHQILVEVDIGDNHDLYAVDLVSGKMTRMVKPLPSAEIFGGAISGRSVAYLASDGTGLRVWFAAAPELDASLIYESNVFLKQISAAAVRKIEYRSMEGEELEAWALLPPDYRRDKKYPLITWVYPGMIAGPTPPIQANIGFVNQFNLQIPAGHGYAVLIPSVPFPPMGVADDPLMRLPNGVLPAVNKVIDLGIADPDRVFLLGHSYGAFSTYGLIAQTNRFRAAAAIGWHSDVISAYGQLRPPFRFDDDADEDISSQGNFEIGLRFGGAPPWGNLGRWLRNNPIFYVDRLQTPLLMIQGEEDGVVQSEEFFMFLHRQGKRAQLARYWGESHVFRTMPNIRDSWHRIFAWFDEFGDISRDQQGNLVLEGDKVKSRNGATPLKPEDFARFDQMILKSSKQ